MDGLPVLVGARPPGVVPQPAPVRLLLVADHLRDLPALPGQLGHPAQDGHPARTSAYHAHLLARHSEEIARPN